MSSLIKIPQREFERVCIKHIKNKCITCDFTLCAPHECVFMNDCIKHYVNFRLIQNISWLYFFLYYPQFVWRFPKSKKRTWCIHHKDLNHFNNSDGNLQLITLSLHMKLHRKLSNPFSDIGSDGLNVAQRFAKETSIRTTKSNNDKVLKGIHPWQGNNNLCRHTKKYKLLMMFLQKLESGSTQVTKELAKFIGYSTKSNLLRIIILVVNRDFHEIRIETFGEFNKRKDYLVKD